MGFMKPDMPNMTPNPNAGGGTSVTNEPPPTAPIQGQRPRRKAMSPTFLGSDSTPNMGGAGGGGGKTLIGQ